MAPPKGSPPSRIEKPKSKPNSRPSSSTSSRKPKRSELTEYEPRIDMGDSTSQGETSEVARTYIRTDTGIEIPQKIARLILSLRVFYFSHDKTIEAYVARFFRPSPPLPASVFNFDISNKHWALLEHIPHYLRWFASYNQSEMGRYALVTRLAVTEDGASEFSVINRLAWDRRVDTPDNYVLDEAESFRQRPDILGKYALGQAKFFAVQFHELWFDWDAHSRGIIVNDPRRWPKSWIVAYMHFVTTGTMPWPCLTAADARIPEPPDFGRFKKSEKRRADEVLAKRGWILGDDGREVLQRSPGMEIDSDLREEIDKDVEQRENRLSKDGRFASVMKSKKREWRGVCDNCKEFEKVGDRFSNLFAQGLNHARVCTRCFAYWLYGNLKENRIIENGLPCKVGEPGIFEYDPRRAIHQSKAQDSKGKGEDQEVASTYPEQSLQDLSTKGKEIARGDGEQTLAKETEGNLPFGIGGSEEQALAPYSPKGKYLPPQSLIGMSRDWAIGKQILPQERHELTIDECANCAVPVEALFQAARIYTNIAGRLEVRMLCPACQTCFQMNGYHRVLAEEGGEWQGSIIVDGKTGIISKIVTSEEWRKTSNPHDLFSEVNPTPLDWQNLDKVAYPVFNATQWWLNNQQGP